MAASATTKPTKPTPPHSARSTADQCATPRGRPPRRRDRSDQVSRACGAPKPGGVGPKERSEQPEDRQEGGRRPLVRHADLHPDAGGKGDLLERMPTLARLLRQQDALACQVDAWSGTRGQARCRTGRLERQAPRRLRRSPPCARRLLLRRLRREVERLAYAISSPTGLWLYGLSAGPRDRARCRRLAGIWLGSVCGPHEQCRPGEDGRDDHQPKA